MAELYDEPLAAVVKTYQETKGLTVDGVIGVNTTRSLNTSIDDRIEQVIANLERRRWLPEDLGSRYVLVNAGDYSMVFVDGGQKVFESLVIVGTPKDPTPEIQSVMHGFQTNPYWTVPQSIAGEEYLPMLRRDPDALARGGFKIFSSWSDNDSELDPATVDWSSIHPKAFPYRIRQEPGAGNALGYIFFGFANKYGIYMHDTANRWLFTEGSRNFSHGCIRLQNPLDFAEKVFKGRSGLRQGARAAGDRRGPAGALRLPRAGDAPRDLPHRQRRERRHGGVPRRRLRPRQAGRRRDGQAAQLTITRRACCRSPSRPAGSPSRSRSWR